MPEHWFNPQWWWLCPLFMIVFFILCGAAARRGRRALCCPPFRRWSLHEDPNNILDRRYASGDISREEYETKRRDIRRTPEKQSPPQ